MSFPPQVIENDHVRTEPNSIDQSDVGETSHDSNVSVKGPAKTLDVGCSIVLGIVRSRGDAFRAALPDFEAINPPCSPANAKC